MTHCPVMFNKKIKIKKIKIKKCCTFLMGKATCDVGATEAARKLSAKLGLRLNESTMRGIN